MFIFSWHPLFQQTGDFRTEEEVSYRKQDPSPTEGHWPYTRLHYTLWRSSKILRFVHTKEVSKRNGKTTDLNLFSLHDCLPSQTQEDGSLSFGKRLVPADGTLTIHSFFIEKIQFSSFTTLDKQWCRSLSDYVHWKIRVYYIIEWIYISNSYMLYVYLHSARVFCVFLLISL